ACRYAALCRKRPGSIACAILRHKETAPRSHRRRLQPDVLLENSNSRLRMLRLEERAAQSLQGLGAAGPQRKRLFILLLRTWQIVLVERDRAFAHHRIKTRRFQRLIEPRVAGAILFRLFQKADGPTEVRLLHADIAHARQRSRALRLVGKDSLEACLGLIQ